MNIIECTIKMKEESRAHYERLAEAVQDKEVRRLFTLLASAEEEQLAALNTMNKRMSLEGGEAGNLSGDVCTFRPLLRRENLAQELRNDPDAYRHVISEERETMEFFKQLVEESQDEKMKRVCRMLADQERKHMDQVENIYSFVEDPRTYLEWGEFSNFKTL
jgi:hypothetical protein